MNDKFLTALAMIGMVVGILILVAVVSLLLAYPTMWTWNYVMPYLFGFKTLNFWQAFSINYLAGSLIKGSQKNNMEKYYVLTISVDGDVYLDEKDKEELEEELNEEGSMTKVFSKIKQNDL